MKKGIFENSNDNVDDNAGIFLNPCRRSSTSDASTSCQRSPDSIMPEPQHAQRRVPPMTFDQQTQTDKSLYDRLVPASAAQMSHQIEEIAQIQSQNNAILASLSEVYRNQMIFNNNFTHCTNVQEEIMRKLRAIEENVEQLKQSEKLRSAPENSIYLQLTPDECSPSENLVIDTEAQPVEEAKPELRTYKAPYKKNKICHQLENEENVTPNVKRVKVAASPEASGESSTSQMVYRPEEDIVIGPNGTKVAAQVLKGINWACPSVATRKILVAVFSRNILATHSLSGKPSPGKYFQNLHDLPDLPDFPKKPSINPIFLSFQPSSTGTPRSSWTLLRSRTSCTS